MNVGGIPGESGRVRPLLVGLVDARRVENVPGELLASAGSLCDAIVAVAGPPLSRILEADPLVARVVAPAGDGDARDALIEAAASLEPEWVITLAPGERVELDDAKALRAFLERTALPGFAYGLIDDSEPEGWSYRVVAFDFARTPATGLEGPAAAGRMVRTAARIRRLDAPASRGGDTAPRPGPDAAGSPFLVGDPMPRWMPRQAQLPALADAIGVTEEAFDLDAPALSVIVCAGDGTDPIDRARAVAMQSSPEPFEVIIAGGESARDLPPDVRHVPGPANASPEQTAAAGIAAARGDYVVVIPPGPVPGPNLIEGLLKAHDDEVRPAVAPAVTPGAKTTASWAAYLLDHARELPTIPPGRLDHEPSVCSFDRETLLQAESPDAELPENGWRRLEAHRASDLLVTDPGVRGAIGLVRREIRYGRRAAARLLHEHRSRGRLLDADGIKASLGWARARRRLVESCVARWGDDEVRAAHRDARRMLWLGSIASSVGLWARLLKPAHGAARTLFGKPALTIAIAGLDRFHIPEGRPGGRTDLLILVHVDLVGSKARVVAIPRDLYAEIPGYGAGRINAAYHHGAIADPRDLDAGVKRLRETIRYVLGVPVDEHIVMRYAGFRRLVDALGGIEVHVEHEIRDEYFSAYFSTGTQRFDGERALKYVRTRKADSDTHRRRRHFDVLMALMHQAKGIRNPARALRVVVAAKRSMRTSVGLRRLLSLARAGRKLSMSSLRMASLAPPLIRAGKTELGADVYRGDPTAIKHFVRESLGLPAEPPADRLELLRPTLPSP